MIEAVHNRDRLLKARLNSISRTLYNVDYKYLNAWEVKEVKIQVNKGTII